LWQNLSVVWLSIASPCCAKVPQLDVREKLAALCSEVTHLDQGEVATLKTDYLLFWQPLWPLRLTSLGRGVLML